MFQKTEIAGGRSPVSCERAIADLHRSATQAGLQAMDASPSEATMQFLLKFGHHLQLLYGLMRDRPANKGEQPRSQPSVVPASSTRPRGTRASQPKDLKEIASRG